MGKVGSLRLCKSKGATQHNTTLMFAFLFPEQEAESIHAC